MRPPPLSRPTLALALALTLALAYGAAASAAAPGSAPSGVDGLPRLDIEAPSALWGEAATLHAMDRSRLLPVQRLVGVPSGGPPIRVLLVPEDDPLARRTPPSISGFAVPEQDLVVLLPRRVLSYPNGSLEELLVHEVTHVLLARAAGGRPLPRWFHEGVALVAAHRWELADRGRLLLGGLGGPPATTVELERAFEGGPGEVAVAYALAGAMVQELLRRGGRDAVAEVTAGLATGSGFDDAFAAAAGGTVSEFETAFWRRYRLLYRWLPFLTSGATLWLGITLLAMLAGARRRVRDAAIRRRWEAEEAAERARLLLGDLAGPRAAAGVDGAGDDADDDLAALPAHRSRWGPH